MSIILPQRGNNLQPGATPGEGWLEGVTEVLDPLCDSATSALVFGLASEEAAAAAGALTLSRAIPGIGWAVAGAGLATIAYCTYRGITAPHASQAVPQNPAEVAKEADAPAAAPAGEAANDQSDATEEAYAPPRRMHDLRADLADALPGEQSQLRRTWASLDKTLEVLWAAFDELAGESGDNPTPLQLEEAERLEHEIKRLQRQFLSLHAGNAELSEAQQVFIREALTTASADPAVGDDALGHLHQQAHAVLESHARLQETRLADDAARADSAPAQMADEWRRLKRRNASKANNPAATNLREAWNEFTRTVDGLYAPAHTPTYEVSDALKARLRNLLASAAESHHRSVDQLTTLKKEINLQRRELIERDGRAAQSVARVSRQLRDVDASLPLPAIREEALLDEAADAVLNDPLSRGSPQVQEIARLQRRFSAEKMAALKSAVSDAVAQRPPGASASSPESVRLKNRQDDLNAALIERSAAYRAFFQRLLGDGTSRGESQ